jgi:hypothetical protein
MTIEEQIDAALRQGAAAALKRCADLQRRRSVAFGEGSGESATALRVAAVLDDLQREFSSAVSRAMADAP